MFRGMLDWYIHECMLSQNLSNWYQKCNISQILIFGGYVNVGESLFIQVIIWVNTFLDWIKTRAIVPKYEGFLHAMPIEMNDLKNK